MITVKYPNGKSERRTFALITGDNPIGSKRPIPDEAILELLDGCITITAGKDNARTTIIWPWARVTEVDLGPKVAETVLLRESKRGGL